MDAPDIPAARLHGALRGLERINFFSGSAGQLWQEIRPLAERALGAGETLRVLDIATGAGDTPLRIARFARREGIALKIAGCDRNADAVGYARARAAHAGEAIEFFACDFFTAPPAGEYDVIMCSLFLHHLDQQQAGRLLRWMGETARRLVLVDDLIRGAAGYGIAWVGVRLLSRSEVVHTDGPRSVEGAFTLNEARGLAEASGLHGCTLRWHWPFRFMLRWERGT